jgi:hypothetical protein
MYPRIDLESTAPDRCKRVATGQYTTSFATIPTRLDA